MIVYFNNKGVVKEQFDSYGILPVVGSTNFQIFAYFDGLNPNNDSYINYSEAIIRFKRPDLEGSEYPVLFMQPAKITFDGTGYNAHYFQNGQDYYGFVFDFTKVKDNDSIVKLLDTPGLWQASITLLNSSTGSTVTGLITFSVGGAVSELDEDATQLSYDVMIQNIAQQLANYVLKSQVVLVIDHLSDIEDWTAYSDGQLFYDNGTGLYYVADSESDTGYVLAEGIGLLGSKKTIARYGLDVVNDNKTIAELYTMFNTKVFVLNIQGVEYICQISRNVNNVATCSALNLASRVFWYSDSLSSSAYFISLLVNTYMQVIASKAYVDDSVNEIVDLSSYWPFPATITTDELTKLQKNNARIVIGGLMYEKYRTYNGDLYFQKASLSFNQTSTDYDVNKGYEIVVNESTRQVTASIKSLAIYDKAQTDTKLATKLDKVTTSTGYDQVYVRDVYGNQTTINAVADNSSARSIVKRRSDGHIFAGGLSDTFNSNDAVTKNYVDNKVGSLGTVMNIKGSKTVSELNALTGMTAGDVYNVLDSGTLTIGNVEVLADDNVVWTSNGVWDKLSASLDLGERSTEQIQITLHYSDIDTSYLPRQLVISNQEITAKFKRVYEKVNNKELVMGFFRFSSIPSTETPFLSPIYLQSALSESYDADLTYITISDRNYRIGFNPVNYGEDGTIIGLYTNGYTSDEMVQVLEWLASHQTNFMQFTFVLNVPLSKPDINEGIYQMTITNFVPAPYYIFLTKPNMDKMLELVRQNTPYDNATIDNLPSIWNNLDIHIKCTAWVLFHMYAFSYNYDGIPVLRTWYNESISGLPVCITYVQAANNENSDGYLYTLKVNRDSIPLDSVLKIDSVAGLGQAGPGAYEIALTNDGLHKLTFLVFESKKFIGNYTLLEESNVLITRYNQAFSANVPLIESIEKFPIWWANQRSQTYAPTLFTIILENLINYSSSIQMVYSPDSIHVLPYKIETAGAFGPNYTIYVDGQEWISNTSTEYTSLAFSIRTINMGGSGSSGEDLENITNQLDFVGKVFSKIDIRCDTRGASTRAFSIKTIGSTQSVFNTLNTAFNQVRNGGLTINPVIDNDTFTNALNVVFNASPTYFVQALRIFLQNSYLTIDRNYSKGTYDYSVLNGDDAYLMYINPGATPDVIVNLEAEIASEVNDYTNIRGYVND